MKIAIADDESILLIHLNNILHSLLPDAAIDSFLFASELLRSAEKIKYDIVFLDIRMPGMNGVELAKKIQQTNNRINIIFVTGYDGYQGDAMDLFASGYIKKPATREKIQTQLNHLRFPVNTDKKRIYAQTFGDFTLFVDGNPVVFSRGKSQTVVAYLIHRRGSIVTKQELSAAVFDDGLYDANRRSYISKLCSDIQTTMKKYRIDDFLILSPQGISVNLDSFYCDLYDYLSGKQDAVQKYAGEYMNQYSFGEEMISVLTKQKP